MGMSRYLAGMEPEKLSTNVLKIMAGSVANTTGDKIYELTSPINLDISAVGVNGRDPLYALTQNSDWSVILLGNDLDDSVSGILTRGRGWSEITCPDGYHFVRKL